jgi:hypothetical protein
MTDTQWLIFVVAIFGIGIGAQLQRIGKALDGIHSMLMRREYPDED